MRERIWTWQFIRRFAVRSAITELRIHRVIRRTIGSQHSRRHVIACAYRKAKDDAYGYLRYLDELTDTEYSLEAAAMGVDPSDPE